MFIGAENERPSFYVAIPAFHFPFRSKRGHAKQSYSMDYFHPMQQKSINYLQTRKNMARNFVSNEKFSLLFEDKRLKETMKLFSI